MERAQDPAICFLDIYNPRNHYHEAASVLPCSMKSIICNSQGMETTCLPTDERITKMLHVCVSE